MNSKQASNPALSSIIRDRRVQVLPVQWRALLTFEHEQSEEDQQHDMDNRFTMGDITLNKSIPYVRELTNSVRGIGSRLTPSVIQLANLLSGLARYPTVHVASSAENDRGGMSTGKQAL
jgi:hypothetical protein